MNAHSPAEATARSRSSPRPPRPKKATRDHAVQGGTGEANRQAMVILEVLAGERSPAEAATAMGLSLVRYFQLETRALQGLVAALEPLPKGKQPSLEGHVKQLERQLQQARREGARQQALVRIARRSFGLPVTTRTEKEHHTKDSAGRKKRRPSVRALKVVRALRARDKAAAAASGPEVGPPETATSAAKNDRQELAATVQLESSGSGGQHLATQEAPAASS